jgi:hypothetical protein
LGFEVLVMHSLNERFRVLIKGGVVIPEAAEIAMEAVRRLQEKHGSFPDDKLNMFSTHLASALTRLDRRETIDPPPEELLTEMKASSGIQEAMQEVAWVERRWGRTLPDAEKQFLMIHYTSLLQEMEG